METKLNYTEVVCYKSKITGDVFLKEERAQKSGLCECGNLLPSKNRCFCDECELKKHKEKEERGIKRYMGRPVQMFTGRNQILYDENADMWFDDVESVIEHYDELDDVDILSARLLICEPTYLSTFDTDLWEQDIHEDYIFKNELIEALGKVNEIAAKTIGSYSPGLYRIDIKDYL